MIVDAGGGTVDISSYAFLSVTPLAVEEVTSADCEWMILLVANDPHSRGLLDQASSKDQLA